MLSHVSSAVCLTPAARIETPLSVATPLRKLTRQPSSFAPLVKAVPSTPAPYPAAPKVSNCVASVVASAPPTSVSSAAVSATTVPSATVSLPSSCLRSASSFTSAGACSPIVGARRMATSASSSCLDVRDRRSHSCMASMTRTESPIMKRSASPVRPSTAASSPLMHSRLSLQGNVRVNSWHSSSTSGSCKTSRTSVMGKSGNAQNLCSSMLASACSASVTVPSGKCSGSASVAVPSGRCSVTVPSGSASVVVPSGSATVRSSSHTGSASVALPLGNCMRSCGSASRLPSVDRMFSMPQEGNGSFAIDDLQYDTPEFDPASPKCLRQLVLLLGLSRSARIEPLVGHAGGLNKGLWAVHGSSEALILKLVNSQRSHPMLPTETECFVKLAREYPSLSQDRDLAFPLKIFHCRRRGGSVTHDLIVMRRAPGESFSDLVSRKWKGGRAMELMNHFDAAGCFLASIHNRYGLQHGDFQPNNLFYDEATNRFTMIDVADLSSSMVITESDVDHFCKGVRLLASVLGDQLHIDGLRRFQAGYGKTRH
mmetsp:Transcript_19110/g.30668  ORF Transcript_19110/g.30668 Transcript_19110/m.30668 type:complete len:541 (+) Transcript_19110:41-1663(+)